MREHTPGPWSFDGPLHSLIVWGPDPNIRVCFMTSDGPCGANARLIATAPDLLSIVVRLRESLTNGERNRDTHLSVDHDELRALVSDARSAIVKALGDS